jgi:hypothetical protein
MKETGGDAGSEEWEAQAVREMQEVRERCRQ